MMSRVRIWNKDNVHAKQIEVEIFVKKYKFRALKFIV